MNYHLIILVHGLWGNPSHMGYIEKQIKHCVPKNSKDTIVVYKTGSHCGFLTYDGIDVNGKRIADEIQLETTRLERDGKVVKFSIVGYSLGGLIARYAIGVLYHQEYFMTIEPINFITFCSPHVGALTTGCSISHRIFNNIVPYILARTGSQIFLRDKKCIKFNNLYENTMKLPLLEWMSSPSSIFYNALSDFKYRSLYANVINDKRTAWFTAGISTTNPFHFIDSQQPELFDFEYIDGFSPVVIDFKNPIVFKKVERPQESLVKESGSKLLSNFLGKFKWSKIILTALIITPIWAINLIASSVFERLKLNKRVKSFFQETSLLHLYSYCEGSLVETTTNDSTLRKDNSNHDSSSSTITQLGKYEQGINEIVAEHAQDFVEAVYERMDEGGEDYGYVSNQNSDEPAEANECTSISKIDEVAMCEQSSIHEIDKHNHLERLNYFALSLSTVERNIIHNLNTLRWERFPIIIRKTKLTHAASIVRMEIPAFEEGKVVVDHFLSKSLHLE